MDGRKEGRKEVECFDLVFLCLLAHFFPFFLDVFIPMGPSAVVRWSRLSIT